MYTGYNEYIPEMEKITKLITESIMNFSTETVQEAIDLVFVQGLQNASQEALKALVVSNCAQIEGDKIRAEYEARYVKDDRIEELVA